MTDAALTAGSDGINIHLSLFQRRYVTADADGGNGWIGAFPSDIVGRIIRVHSRHKMNSLTGIKRKSLMKKRITLIPFQIVI